MSSYKMLSLRNKALVIFSFKENYIIFRFPSVIVYVPGIESGLERNLIMKMGTFSCENGVSETVNNILYYLEYSVINL